MVTGEKYDDALMRLRIAARNARRHHVGAVGDGRVGENGLG